MDNDILIWGKHRNKKFDYVLKYHPEYCLEIIKNENVYDIKYKNKYKNFVKFREYIQKNINKKITKKSSIQQKKILKLTST